MGELDFNRYNPMQIHEMGHEYGYNLGFQTAINGKKQSDEYSRVMSSTEVPDMYKTGFSAGYTMGYQDGQMNKEENKFQKKIYRRYKFRQSMLIFVVAIIIVIGIITFGYLDQTGQTLTQLIFG